MVTRCFYPKKKNDRMALFFIFATKYQKNFVVAFIFECIFFARNIFIIGELVNGRISVISSKCNSFLMLQVPKVSSMGNSNKKEAPIPADLAKRPEITITPIPRSFNETMAAAAAAAAASNPLSVLGPGFPSNLNLKALGIDLPELNMMDLNALSNLSDFAKKYDKNSFGAMAAATMAAAAVAASQQGPSCEPSAKRFKADDSGRLNGANSGRHASSMGRGPHGGIDMQAAASELSKLHSVPDLVSADLLRSMNMLDANSKLLVPAHQSTKTINALAALLPQTSIFPASAPAAHQQSSRSPMKTSQSDSPRPEPPRVFQSQSVYSQSSRIYDKPTADHARTMNASPKDSREMSKGSSPEIQILDLSRPPSSLGGGPSSSSGKNGKGSKSERLDVELLDLSTRRDITVSAVPKPVTSNKHSRSSLPQVSIKSSDGVTITPNHSNNSSSNSNSRNFRGAGSLPLGNLSSADLSSLMGSMPNAALMAAAAAAAQGLPQGLPQGLAHGLPPGLASLGLGGPGSMPPGNLPASLIPFLLGSTAGPSSGSKSSSSVPQQLPPHSSYLNNTSSSSASSSSNSNTTMPPMFPYVDNSLAAYYNSLLPPSLASSTASSSPATSMSSASMAAAQQAAVVQMAQLNSLGLGAGLPGGLPAGLLGSPGMPPNSNVTPEALANLGMYKNFLGGAAASAASSSSGSSGAAQQHAHFLAALMAPGGKQKK